MKPVMLATDGSLSAEAATEEAIELARAFGAPLVVVCVAHASAPPYGAAYIGYGELYSELRKAEADHADQVLAETRERATAAGVDCTTVALEGLPGEEICREAEAQSHDSSSSVPTAGDISAGSCTAASPPTCFITRRAPCSSSTARA